MNITEKFVRKSIKVLSFNAFSFRKVYNFPTGKMIVSAEQTFSIYSCTTHLLSRESSPKIGTSLVKQYYDCAQTRTVLNEEVELKSKKIENKIQRLLNS